MKTASMKLLIAIISCILCQSGAVSASGEAEAGNNPDITLRTGLQINDPSITLHPNQVNGYDSDTDYTPNSLSHATFELIYKGLGFSFSNKISDDATNNLIYGRTESRDFTLFFCGVAFSIDAYYFRRKGVYITEDYTPTVENPYPQRPDIEIITTGMRFSYLISDFKTGFSFESAVKRTSRARNVQAGFLLMVSPFYFSIDGDHNLIPPDKAHLYPGIASLDKCEFYVLSAMPGFAVNVPLWVFYVTSSLNAGPAATVYRFMVNSEPEWHTRWRRTWAYDIVYTLGFGIDADFIFTGLTFTIDTGEFWGRELTIGYTNVFLELFAGIRI